MHRKRRNGNCCRAGVESALDRRSRSVGYDGVVHNEIVVSLREAYDGEKETVPLKESEGRISGEFLYLYPPGIPLLMPGERISRDVPPMWRPGASTWTGSNMSSIMIFRRTRNIMSTASAEPAGRGNQARR